MVKLMWFLLQTIYTANAALLRNSISSGNGLIYIGSFNSQTLQGSSYETKNFDENKYYVSVNPTVWQSADDDCKNRFGSNAGLVAIESNEEWDFLKEMLESYGFATTYWTSGFYDAETSQWMWAKNLQYMPLFPPWGAGFPSGLDSDLRIYIFHNSRFSASWRTVLDTEMLRYICEVPRTTVDLTEEQVGIRFL